jgi:hypothetical protein
MPRLMPRVRTRGFVFALLLVMAALGVSAVRLGGSPGGPKPPDRPARVVAPALNTEPQDLTVVARFGGRSANVPLDPTPELRKLITSLVERLKAEGAIGAWPEVDPSRGFRFDLDGDSRDEYFVGIGGGATGNTSWAIFADKPAKYLGEAFGAYVFIHARTARWSPITSWARMGSDQAMVTRLVVGEPPQERLIEDSSGDGRPFLRLMGLPPCGSRGLDVSDRNCHEH